MPDETRSQPDETEDERRPSHLNEDGDAETEGHMRLKQRNEDDDDAEVEVEGHMRPKH
jgi:hypothetical protein